MYKDIELAVPGTCICLKPGCKLKIHRFDSDIWTVNFGWFSFDGNREICGWYMVRLSDAEIKPIFKCDLNDCYLIQN